MNISLLNRLWIWIYYAPTLIGALILYALVPVFCLIGKVFPDQIIPFMSACGKWADAKSKEVTAAQERLARKGGA